MNTDTAALTAAAARITAAQDAEWNRYLAECGEPVAQTFEVGQYVRVGRSGKTVWLVLAVEGETLTLGTRPTNQRWSTEKGFRRSLTRTEQAANVTATGTVADIETLVGWGLARRSLIEAVVAVATVTYEDGTEEQFDTLAAAEKAAAFARDEMGIEATITLR